MQYTDLVTNRPNISEHLAAAIRRMISTGTLPADQRVNEVHLAATLNVSRTPLREALMALVAEGALTSVPRRGFFVQALTVDEFTSLYRIRALLDPEALTLSGLPSQAQILSLINLNEKFEQSTDVETRIDLDDMWHLELVTNCQNTILIDLITQFMSRTRRYEYAYMKQHQHVPIVHNQHQEIILALKKGDLPAACNALRQNLRSGLVPICTWLNSLQTK